MKQFRCFTAAVLFFAILISVPVSAYAAETSETGSTSDRDSGGHYIDKETGGHSVPDHHDYPEGYTRRLSFRVHNVNEDGEVFSYYIYHFAFSGEGTINIQSYYFYSLDFARELGMFVFSDADLDILVYRDCYINGKLTQTDKISRNLKLSGDFCYSDFSLGLLSASQRHRFDRLPNMHVFTDKNAYDAWRKYVLYSNIDFTGDDISLEDPDGGNGDTGNEGGDNSGDGDNPGNGDNPGDGDSKPSFDIDFSNIFTLIYTILKALIDFIVSALNMLVEFANLLMEQTGQFAPLIGAVFTFLPEEFITMILSGIVIIIIIGIVKK